AGVLIAARETPHYVATMTISNIGPGEGSLPDGSTTGVLQVLRGFAGTTPLSGDYAYFVALLSSDRVAARLYRDEAFRRRLFASEWNAAARRWERPPGPMSDLKAWYGRTFFDKAYQPPDVQRMKERLTGGVKVRFDLTSG